QPVLLPALVLASIGFIAMGLAVGNRLVVQLVTILGRLLALAGSAVLGLAFGVAAFLAWWLWGNPDQGLADALSYAASAVHDPGDPLQAFAFAGLAAGLLAGFY